MSASVTLQFENVPRKTFELLTGLRLKVCRLCGDQILEGEFRRDVSMRHLDEKHPTWRDR